MFWKLYRAQIFPFDKTVKNTKIEPLQEQSWSNQFIFFPLISEGKIQPEKPRPHKFYEHCRYKGKVTWTSSSSMKMLISQ